MMQHLNIEHLNDATEGGDLASLKSHKSNRPPSDPSKKTFWWENWKKNTEKWFISCGCNWLIMHQFNVRNVIPSTRWLALFFPQCLVLPFHNFITVSHQIQMPPVPIRIYQHCCGFTFIQGILTFSNMHFGDLLLCYAMLNMYSNCLEYKMFCFVIKNIYSGFVFVVVVGAASWQSGRIRGWHQVWSSFHHHRHHQYKKFVLSYYAYVYFHSKTTGTER